MELIRVDEKGEQVGDVLAETHTSTNGNYKLTLPTGVDLAGNLIVRITGASNSELRAQVVHETVNISPVSEFILRKFIEDETDLTVLEPGAVLKLSGHVEQFDLTVGADLSEMFDQLEAAVGEFIESQIDVIHASPSNAEALSGNYRSATLQLALHDSNHHDYGTFGVDLWRSNFTFTGNPDGTVDVDHSSEESAWGSLHGNDTQGVGLNYWADIDDESETFTASFNNSNVLAIEGEFDEEIEDEFAWRWPPVTYRLQKVQDQHLFFLLNQEASVRYATIDTDGDSVNDALNPDAPEGDEVTRGIEVFFQAATGMTTNDVNGSFGRVYLGVMMHQSGHMEIEVEANKLEINAGSVDYGAAERYSISRNSAGQVAANVGATEAEEFEMAIAPDGQILVNGEETDGYFNATADFAAFAEANGENDGEANFAKTFFVKLPQGAPAVTNKRYRLMFLDAHFSGRAFRLTNTRFDSFLRLTSNTAGTAVLGRSTLSKANLGANVVAGVIAESEREVTAQIGTDGAATLHINDQDGMLRLNGYWHASGSYGVFNTGFIPTGQTIPVSAGLAVLIEVAE